MIETVLVFLAGLAAGVCAGALALAWRGRVARDAGAELRTRLAQQDAELASCRENERALSIQLARAQADAGAKDTLLRERAESHARELAEARAAMDKNNAALREAFKALSADALRENAPQFLQLATEKFMRLQEGAQGDLAQRQEAISGLVTPLREQLEAYRRQLQQAEQNHAQAQAALKKEIESLTANNARLAEETARFRMVMKSNPARGRWGEATLRNVVESAHLSPHCDFVEQCAMGDARPDMVIKLPGGRLIVVDAKTPDLDFLAALDGRDGEGRAAALAEYAKKLGGTITELSRKAYPEKIPGAIDHAILFLPAESLFSAALEGEPGLLEVAARQHVMLATPATLLAMLNAVRVSWASHDQAENARDIADAARELYKRVTTLVEHFAAIGKSINAAAEAYNRAAASYDTRVRVTGEQLTRLGLPAGGKTLDAVPAIETLARDV